MKTISKYIFFITLKIMLLGCPLLINQVLGSTCQNERFEVGFQLIERKDFSRSLVEFPVGDSSECIARPVRIYIWYPSKENHQQKMTVSDFIELAKDDFCNGKTSKIDCSEPVPLDYGFSKHKLESVKSQKTLSVLNADFFNQKFPVIVVGQGLYYESPFTHFVLCEYLASHGYVVVSCPLKGTQYRLVNLNVTDLETLVRDLEFSLSAAKELPIADNTKIGIIGYDMGGMAGMIMAMRNPDVDAFISLDAGVLYPHYSGLPNKHPNYSLPNLNIPWLHITQSRFCPGGFEKAHPSNAMKQKASGNNYLLLLNTTNHGAFTSYAMLGIENPLRGYWEDDFTNIQPIYETTCSFSLNFLDAYLKNQRYTETTLINMIGAIEDIGTFEMIEKPCLSVSKDMVITTIINQGATAGIAFFNTLNNEDRSRIFADEAELNWLGYHFLYYWNRPSEAIQVFELIARLFPKSANAFDSLAEAWFVSGDHEMALANYKKSLELNPDNQNARQMIEQLMKKHIP